MIIVIMSDSQIYTIVFESNNSLLERLGFRV